MRYTEVRGEVRIGDDIKLGVILNKYLKLRLDEIQLRSKRKEKQFKDWGLGHFIFGGQERDKNPAKETKTHQSKWWEKNKSSMEYQK